MSAPRLPGPVASGGARAEAGAEARLAALRAYYEASTRRFLAFGGSGRSLAIHRGLWAPGVTGAEAAADHVNALIVRRLRALGAAPPARVRDLGCGVGGSLLHLARIWPAARLEGITLSPLQAGLAREYAAARGLAARIAVVCGDFLSAPETAWTQPADLVLAIESHVHAPSAAAFCAAARRHLRRGGLLVVVDDMPVAAETRLSPQERRLLATVRRGWHLGHLTDPGGLGRAAAAAGLALRHDEDLTALLRLDRLRDRLLRGLAPVADALGLGRWAFFSNLIGGNALTAAYRRGLMRYRLTIWEAA